MARVLLVGGGFGILVQLWLTVLMSAVAIQPCQHNADKRWQSPVMLTVCGNQQHNSMQMTDTCRYPDRTVMPGHPGWWVQSILPSKVAEHSRLCWDSLNGMGPRAQQLVPLLAQTPSMTHVMCAAPYLRCFSLSVLILCAAAGIGEDHSSKHTEHQGEGGLVALANMGTAPTLRSRTICTVQVFEYSRLHTAHVV
jgi:hypothetical protein